MPQPIDLQFNYPLLNEQTHELWEILRSELDKAQSLLTLAPTAGSSIDRTIAAKWLSQPNYIIDPDDVYIGSGGHHSCFVALLAAGLQNKTIVVEELTYSNFKSIAGLLNIRLIACAIDDLGIIPAALDEVCRIHKPDALFITPTVNNPMGYVMPVDRRKEIVAIARANNLIIIEDDAYGFLEDAELPNFFHLAPECSFYVYSFSKPLAQSIKTSYLLAPKAYSDKVIETLRSTSSNNSLLLLSALNEYIESGKLKDLILNKRKEGFHRQQKARELLKEYQVSGHKNSYHLWLQLPAHVKSDELNNRLIAAGVKIVPSVAYSVTSEAYNHAIRIALGGESDFNRVIEGIEKIKQQIGEAPI